MKTLRTVIFTCIIGFAFGEYDVAGEFEKFEINPDILNKSPQELIEVKFGDKSAELGNELTPTEVKDVPEIHYDHKDDTFYTLIMIDPDVPSREAPTYREWEHWLVGNIPGEDISKGEVLAEFISSLPPRNSGLHRYVFLVYEQPGKIEFNEPRLTNKSIKPRQNFSVKKFAAKYNLGDPVAGNIFQSQYDDYVINIYKQLGIL